MVKKIIIWIIFFIVWIILFFYISFLKNSWEEQGKLPNVTSNVIIQNWQEIINNISIDDYHNWQEISKILVQENYNKIWINPDNYNTFENFLDDFKTFTWVLIDPINENFTVWIIKNNGDYLFIPFNFHEDKDLFLDKTNKNLAILDIYQAHKNWLLYWGINSEYWNKIVFEKEFQHPETAILNEIFDVNLYDESNNVYNIIDTLNKSDEIWLSNNELLAYLDDFIWNYDEANKNRDTFCKKYKVNCDNKMNLNISWIILDSNSEPIPWVKIELLNNNSINTISGVDWSYSFEFEYYPFSHLRFKSSKTWYSDWFSTYSFNDYFSKSKQKDLFIKFTLNKAHNTFSINNSNLSDYKKWKYYMIETSYSKYFIPMDGLYYLDWRNYKNNNFDVFTYQFSKTSNMNNLLENDTFEPVYGYVWNIMKTFGMPYIQFVDKDTWKELFIKSSNPMILQNQVYHMKELYENSDNIYEKITTEDMKILVEKSEELWWYPIDFDFLTQNSFLRWPARWSLDRITWIWSNVWCRVLNTDWLVELPFYHIKDT